MGKTYLLVNPAKREFLDPSRLGGNDQWDGLFLDQFSLLALKRLIADPPRKSNAIDGRWVGNPVILAEGWGGEDNLHDHAEEDFRDVSYLAISNLCDDDGVFREILEQAANRDLLFFDLCNSLTEFAPDLMLNCPFTTILGNDWSRRFKRVHESKCR